MSDDEIPAELAIALNTATYAATRATALADVAEAAGWALKGPLHDDARPAVVKHMASIVCDACARALAAAKKAEEAEALLCEQDAALFAVRLKRQAQVLARVRQTCEPLWAAAKSLRDGEEWWTA